MQLLIEYARAEGIRSIEGQVLQENTTMLNMCRELGFEIAHDADEPYICVAKLSLYESGRLRLPTLDVRRQDASACVSFSSSAEAKDMPDIGSTQTR